MRKLGFNEAAFEAECAIILDKLAQGINGIEWLVMTKVVDEEDQKDLAQWLFYLDMRKKYDVTLVMKDALTMSEDEYYSKYQCNWWISLDAIITKLNLLRKHNYDSY